jgi:monoamine oxidase
MTGSAVGVIYCTTFIASDGTFSMTNWLDIAQKGLPETSGPRKKVLILGAGVAGMVAAVELLKRGHTPIVLEARMRPGGRVYTLRAPFAHGLHAEAGAMRIPISHDLSMHYIQRFGLELYPFTSPNPQAYYHLRGNKFRRAELDKDFSQIRSHFPGLSTVDTVWKHWEDTVRVYVEKVRNEGDEGWTELLETLDWLSVRAFLELKGWTEDDIELYGLLSNEEAEMNFSIIQVLREEIQGDYATLNQIKGGTDQLTDALFRELGHCVRLGAVVRAIGQTADAAVVHYETEGGRFTETADYMITTIPFAVMRHIDVLQPFSPAKQKAIRELHYHASGKVFLQCKRRFWEEDEGIYGGGTITDLPIRNLFYPEHGQETGRGVLLASYTWETDAKRWSSLTPEARIDRAVEYVSKIHPQILEECEGGASVMWQDDPYAGGAFALFEPGQETRLFDSIIAPEGRIHFAGEHASRLNGWIQGSIESGLRAALEINNL